MRGFKFACFLALALSFTLLGTPAFSQSTTAGDIAGTITDPSGAVVPNIKVTAKADATGESRNATTSGEGFYRFSLLQPGSYTVEVSGGGFQVASRKVQVGVGQTSTVNIALAVSGANTVVEVNAQAVQIENADNSTSFGTQQIAELPNPGNDLSAVAQTAPGVVQNTQSGFGNFSTYGLPGTSNLFTLDGQNDNDPFLNLNNSGATNLLLGINEVQEATVTTNGYSGQYGQLAGSQINYVTKSGANAWHGNAVYFWNGRVLNANNFLNNATSPATPKPFDNVNQWAASFSGPLRKDKTFFFFNYEGLRVVLPTSSLVKIPSPQFQAATIANLNSSAHSASVPFYQNMFNLWNGAAGASRAVPVPDGTGGCDTFSGLAPGTPCALQFQAGPTNFTHEYQMAIRIDHNFNDSNKLFARVQTDRGVQATITDPINPLFNTQSTQPEYQGQLGWTHFFGSNAVNEFKTSGQWYSAIFDNANPTASLAAYPTTLRFVGGAFSGLGGADFVFPQGRNVTQYQFVDDYSWTRGKHTWKFGMGYHRNDVSDFDYGLFTRGLGVTTLDTFFTGGVDFFQQNFLSRKSQPIAVYGLGLYAQDEWRVTNKLKLTLALRGDHNSNPVCQTNCFARLAVPFTSLNHTNSGNIPYNQTIQTGLHQAYPATDNIVWQPRLGFTFSPFGNNKTVFRGGIGIFSDSFPAVLVDNFSSNPPIVNSFVVAGDFAPGQAGNVFSQTAAGNSAFRAGFGSGATFNQLSLINGFVAPGISSSDKTIRQPRYQEWNFEVQQDIGWSTVLSINYVGNHGTFEAVQNNSLNAFADTTNFPTGFAGLPSTPPDQRFGTVNQIQSIAVSNYNGLVTSVRHAFNHGFAAQANYTWSHAFDEVSNGGLLPFNAGTSASLLFPVNPFNIRQNYGNSDYDVRHYFSANYVWDNSLRHLFHWGPNALFSGWNFSGTLFSRSGLPFSVVDGGTSQVLNGDNFGGTILAGIIGPTQNGSCGKPNATPGAGGAAPPSCLNIAGFDPNPTGLAINQRRNQFRGPGYFDTDFGIMKKTKLTEKTELGLGVQFFNILNHPSFDQPVNDISAGNFGQVVRTVNTPTSILGSFLGGDASPRLIQLKAQFNF